MRRAASLIGVLHQRTGNLSAVMLVLAAITAGCALFFPGRPEELQPELREQAPGKLPVAAG